LEFLESEGISVVNAGPAEIKRHLTKLLDAKYSWSTRNGTYTALQVFYELLKARGYVQENPFEVEKIKRPRKTEKVQYLIELEVLQALFDKIRADGSPTARRDYAIILLMFDTGLRRTEAVSLKISDVKIKERQITVRIAKNSNQRRVPFKEPFLQALQDWLAVHPNQDSGLLFVALKGKSKGNQLSSRRVNGILESWIQKTGLQGPDRVTPHGLRRAFATYFSDTGGDMFALRDILGHKQIETTKGYIINTGKRLQRQHEKYSPVNLLNFG
jgi:site-specific recombinase XerD